MNIVFGKNLNRAFTHHMKSSFSQYDLVVVGGGPGGYVAAIKAA